jgi:hypothetical protein
MPTPTFTNPSSPTLVPLSPRLSSFGKGQELALRVSQSPSNVLTEVLHTLSRTQ